MATIQIKKPSDLNEYFTTTITCDTFQFVGLTIFGDRSAKDPIQAGLEQYWRTILSPSKGRYSYDRSSFNRTFTHLVKINSCPVLLSRQGIRYEVNGKSYNLASVASALSRITYKSCFEDDAAKLLLALYSTLQLPENVKYCLENKVPYHWYEILSEGEDPIKVRLNCQQIGDNEIAIEVSDGVWGTMSVKQLDVFCNYYKNDKNRGSWVATSLEELYERTTGKECSPSEKEVMRAFLMQNRTQDLVEARALQLVNELLEQYPDRLFAEWEGEVLTSMIIKGKDYDWKLTNNKFKSSIQMVSTYVWQPIGEKTPIGVDEDNDTIYETVMSKPEWRGPICIDNMAGGSSLGDQFAARALALLNDRFTITIVNTIRRYLVGNANEYRVDVNEEM
tara:strand:- start:14956 stop:16131 length:1176 start_codon:yes stop_codon:yes gene_type:complete